MCLMSVKFELMLLYYCIGGVGRQPLGEIVRQKRKSAIARICVLIDVTSVWASDRLIAKISYPDFRTYYSLKYVVAM